MNWKERILKIARLLLMMWGGVSLLIAISIIFYFLYPTNFSNQTKDDKASNEDVRFVLNWCELGDQRIEKILHSHNSARSFTGDHLDAYAIKIKDIKEDEINNSGRYGVGKWYPCNQLPKVVDDAVTFISGWDNEVPWFPKEAEIRAANFYVYPWSTWYHGITPNATQLIFINPSEKIVYYISVKM